MINVQTLTQRAIEKIESDAVAYETMGAGYDKTDPERAEACRGMAQYIRGWKTDSQIISKRVRMM